jgi:cytochrome c oxidase subunit 2
MVVLLQVSALPAPDQSPLSTPNILAPSSTPANDIYELSVFVLVLTGAIFAVVGGLILFAVIRFRASRTNSPDEPAQL